jgi:AI-2 transport system permease protein
MSLIKKITKIREMSSLLFLVILFGVVGLINSDFLTPTSLINCLNDSVVFTLLACGIAFTIFTGEIDVSIGAILGITAAVTSTMLVNGSSWIVAVMVGIIIGAVIGIFNGWGVAYLGSIADFYTRYKRNYQRLDIRLYKGRMGENLPVWFYKAFSV